MRLPTLLWLVTAGLGAQSPGPASLELRDAASTLALKTVTAHVQGIETDGEHLWVTSVERATSKGFLQEFSLRDGRLERGIEVQDGDRYHPGGIAAYGDSLWIPVAEYKALSSAVIQKRNRKTFALELQFAVPDHIGCVAVTPEFVIGGNWDSRDFYFWDHQGKLIRKVSSTTGNAYQDLKFFGGMLVASGSVAGGKGAIDWLEMPAMKLARRLPVGNTEAGLPLTREGMLLRGEQLWLLPEDGASRLMMFKLPVQ